MLAGPPQLSPHYKTLMNKMTKVTLRKGVTGRNFAFPQKWIEIQDAQYILMADSQDYEDNSAQK
jgi:hypothetical protein